VDPARHPIPLGTDRAGDRRRKVAGPLGVRCYRPPQTAGQGGEEPRRARPKARAARPSRGPRLGRTVHSASRPCSVRDRDSSRAGAQGRWRIGRHPVRPVL